MGNCMLKGFAVVEVQEIVKVVTSNGGIMELYAPITAERITSEFPGHAIFRGPDQLPLLHSEELSAGSLYYLLPINKKDTTRTTSGVGGLNYDRINTPYRMSFDRQRLSKRSEAAAEVFPRQKGGGVWKVKLVICPEQLSEILSQEARTEELIESVRTVAKCGGSTPRLVSAANSDEWSVSSGWKAVSEKLDK